MLDELKEDLVGIDIRFETLYLHQGWRSSGLFGLST